MLIANYRSPLVKELNAPAAGIERLYTIDGSLIAVSMANEVWVWDWAGLADGPRTRSVKANEVLWLPGDGLILAPSDNSGAIIISDYMNDKRYEQLELNGSWRCEHLGIGGGGRFVALALVGDGSQGRGPGNSKRFRLEMLSPGLDKLVPVATIDKKDDTLMLYELDVSDDGASIAAVGQTNDFAWIGVFNVAQRKIVWEKVVETSVEFVNVAFSPNGEVIYAGGEGRYLYSFETASGEITSRLLMDEEQLMASFNEQRVTCAEVSPDGFVVAAGVNPGNKVYFWNTRTGKRLGVLGGCRGLNNLAFSPDSSTFVVAGRNYGGSLKVRRVPAK
jgi:WD40 repeat protein